MAILGHTHSIANRESGTHKGDSSDGMPNMLTTRPSMTYGMGRNMKAANLQDQLFAF